jgi:hypothetical protein
MWCELYGSGKCFVLFSDYVLAINNNQNSIECPANAIWVDLKKAIWVEA